MCDRSRLGEEVSIVRSGSGGASLFGIATEARAARDGSWGAVDSYEGVCRDGRDGGVSDEVLAT